MDDLITTYEFRITEPGCAPVSGRYGLRIDIPKDISSVFPYLNATLKESKYDPQNHILIWREKDHVFALRPHEIQIGGLETIEDSPGLIKETLKRINEVWHDRERIPPCLKDQGRPAVMLLFKLLPRTNCKQCGYSTCLAFAADLRDDKTRLECCIPLLEQKWDANRQKLQDYLFKGHNF